MEAVSKPQVQRDQLITVLRQIADHSADGDIRGHIRQVADALEGNGLIILNGPPQEELRHGVEAMTTPKHEATEGRAMGGEITAFLQARYGERWELAQAAIKTGNDRYGDDYHSQVQFSDGGIDIDDGWLVVDPELVLRDIAAKRAIMRTLTDRARFDVLRHLATEFSDHPGYKAEWKP